MNIRQYLEQIADKDDKYLEFNRRIVASRYPMLGVRMPALRAFARQLAGSAEARGYLETGLDGDLLYEEVVLYGLVLAFCARKMPLEEVFTKLDRLIALFDSWAHVDVVISSFKIFKRHEDEVYRHFLPLKNDSGEFTKRTFVILSMVYFLDEAHIDRTLRDLAEVSQGQYYVDMGTAWVLSVALIKYYERTVAVLERPVFSRWVHNKAIQKARESFRITPEQKNHLNTLKLK